MYGKELILDLHHCGNATMDINVQAFCEELAELVGMECEEFHPWDSLPEEPKDPKLYGVSGVQFITTSNIIVYVLPLLNEGTVYINLFSCKKFDTDIATKFCENYFESGEFYKTVVDRR